MKVKINEKLICIPPYISTTWDRVAFLQTEHGYEANLTLVLNLIDGNIIKIPNLDSSIIDIAFAAHLKHLERGIEVKTVGNQPPSIEQLGGIPIRFGITNFPGGLEALESTFQHNPAQSGAPDLPKEVLDKIVGITKLMTNGDVNGIPKPEPHCNCMHCQIARVIHEISNEENPVIEDPVSDDDLKFHNWNIAKSGEKLYTVSNPLDPKEHYSVYLGSPVGCTCGQPNCEHILAVLYS